MDKKIKAVPEMVIVNKDKQKARMAEYVKTYEKLLITKKKEGK